MSRMRFGKPVVIGCVTAGLFMVLRSASSPAQQPAALPPYPPTLIEVPAPAGVKVTHMHPIVTVPLKEAAVGPVPKEAEQAIIFARPLKRYSATTDSGRIQLEITADGPVFLAVSWFYDGNTGGGWKPEAWTEQQFAENGWLKVGEVSLWKTSDPIVEPHILVRRDCKAGEKFTLRSRKYTPPLVVMGATFAAPPPMPIAAVAPKAPAPTPTSTAPPLPSHVVLPPPVKPQPEGLVVTNAGPLKTVDLQSFVVEKLPAFLTGAAAVAPPFDQFSDKADVGRCQIEVTRDMPVFIAVSYVYDGRDENWRKEAWDWMQFAGAEWLPVAEFQAVNRRSRLPEVHTLLFKNCKAGERLVLRTRRQNPPIVVVPPAPAPHDVLAFADDPLWSNQAKRAHFGVKTGLLLDGDRFADLEQWVNAYLRRDDKLPGYEAEVIYMAQSGTLDAAGQIKGCQRRLKKLERWLAENPRSTTAQLITAVALITYRYSLFDEGVEAEAEVAEIERRIMELLYEVEQAEPQLPFVYSAYMQFVTVPFGDEGLADSFFAKLVASKCWCPVAVSSYLGLKFDYAEEVDDEFRDKLKSIIETAVAATSDRHGDLLYVAVVAGMCNYTENLLLFDAVDLDWQRLKSSFESLQTRVPRSRELVQAFCFVATFAGDRATARPLFEELGPYRDDDELVWQYRRRYELARIWSAPDFTSGEQRRLFEGPPAPLMTVAWLKQGILFTDESGVMRVSDPETGTVERWSSSTDTCEHMVVRPDRNLSACCARSGLVMVRGLRSNDVAKYHYVEEGAVYSLDLSPDGKQVLAGSDEGNVYVIEVGREELTQSDTPFSAGRDRVTAVAYLDRGRTFLTYCIGEVRVFDAREGKVLNTWRTGAVAAHTVAVSPDGTMAATIGADQTLRLWKIPTGELLGEVPGCPKEPRRLKFSADGRRVAGGCGTYGDMVGRDVFVVDIESQSLLKVYHGHKTSVSDISFAPDGKSLVSVGSDRSVRIWDVPE